ncbi:MAG: FHA domain-containing protein [Verrucomicrobiales bacterium]|nr:FHA domain-containing protein [Verrucomicrobiales bacterium]
MSSQLYNLVVEIPGRPPRHYQLSASVISIGRGDQNSIIVEDDAVSGSHCELRLHERNYRIVDSGSTNGTLLNGERISGVPKKLRDGDRLSLGLTATARFVRVIEVKDRLDQPVAEAGATTMRLRRSPSRPAINPVAAAVAKAAKSKPHR